MDLYKKERERRKKEIKEYSKLGEICINRYLFYWELLWFKKKAQKNE